MKALTKSEQQKRKTLPAKKRARATEEFSKREFEKLLCVARADYQKNFPYRELTDAEVKARGAAWKAMTAEWDRRERENPTTPEEDKRYDRMLKEMAHERNGDYSHVTSSAH